jgi:hypothetical protein
MIVAVIGWIAVGALAAATAAAGLWGMNRLTRSAARELGMPLTPPDSTFVGGALTATVSVTWPLACLELFDWGVRLSSSAKLLRQLPFHVATWEARYEELAVVRSVTGRGTSGLRFAVVGSTDAVVFWSPYWRSPDWPEILDRLEAAGATVDRVPVPLKQAGGVYKTRW